MKSKLKIILPVLLISSSAFILFQIKKDFSLTKNTSSNTQNSNSLSSADKTIAPSNFQKLSVLSNHCRGCGKCVRIDPAHFDMNGNVAIVISSTDLNSSNLKLAINNCPTQAITLE